MGIGTALVRIDLSTASRRGTCLVDDRQAVVALHRLLAVRVTGQAFFSFDFRDVVFKLW